MGMLEDADAAAKTQKNHADEAEARSRAAGKEALEVLAVCALEFADAANLRKVPTVRIKMTFRSRRVWLVQLYDDDRRAKGCVGVCADGSWMWIQAVYQPNRTIYVPDRLRQKNEPPSVGPESLRRDFTSALSWLLRNQ